MVSVRIRFPSSPTLVDAERLVGLIGDSYRASAEPTASISTRMGSLSAFAEPAMLQAFVTLIKAFPAVTVQTALSSTKPDYVRARIAANPTLLAAVLLSDRLLGRGGTDITFACREIVASGFAETGQYVETRSRTFIPAVDSVPSLSEPQLLYKVPTRKQHGSRAKIDETARSLYSSRMQGENLTLLPPGSGPPLGSRIISGARRQLGAGVTAVAPIADSIGEILFELFQNTHYHARHNTEGVPLLKSLRVITSRTFVGSSLLASAREFGNLELSEFLRKQGSAGSARAQQNDPQLTRFLVLSVLDSGPGLASRSLKNAGVTGRVTAQTEMEHLSSVLAGGTRSLERPFHGIGLTKVQEVLTGVGGFMRLRTGRLGLERDFREVPYESTAKNPQWVVKGLAAPGLPRVHGTLYTLVIPVPGREEL